MSRQLKQILLSYVGLVQAKSGRSDAQQHTKNNLFQQAHFEQKDFLKKIGPCENPTAAVNLKYKQAAPKVELSVKSKSAEHKTKESLSGALKMAGGTFKFQTFASI